MSILSKCGLCKGTGRVAKDVPLGANPKAPITNPDRMGKKICPECQGTGTVGIK